MKTTTITLALCLASFATASIAAEQLKPGQWDMTMDVQMKNMPKLSAEDMAAMKQMGIEIPGMGKPMRMQQCVTPEQAAANQPLNPTGNESCKVKNFKQNGNTVTGDLVCTGEMNATGKFETTMNGNTAYSSKMSLKGVSHGEPIDQEVATSGKWVKAKCDPGIPGTKK